MKVVLNIEVKELEKKLNRKIVVDEDISLTNFCEGILVSLNIDKMLSYGLVDDGYCYSNSNFDYSLYENEHRDIDNYLLKDLKLKKESSLELLCFHQQCHFEILIDVLEIVDEKTEDEFTVIDGKGYGFFNNESIYELYRILRYTKKQKENLCTKIQKECLKIGFDKDLINKRIKDYFIDKEESKKPKSYILNVGLEGFNKDIKRKIIVSNNITIDDLCRIVIAAFRGDFSHLYDLKKDKDYLGEEFSDRPLYDLRLKEKQKIYVIYDFGDDWRFKVTISKIVDGYSKTEVLSGKGYGIVDDCGGVYGLYDIFYGENHDDDPDYEGWPHQDINEFDLEECNEDVRKRGEFNGF